jgi:integrase/recombinase XerD
VSRLADVAEDYLRVRRALGYKLDRQGRQLNQFIAYLEQAGASTVTVEHAVAWATHPVGADVNYCSDRLTVARQFARHLKAIDPTCEVPPRRLLPYRRRRPTPHIYTPREIEALINAAGQLRGELHRATMQTLIGLLAVTGMRIGEAIRLDREDVDACHQLVRVIDSKFAKSREVALHPTTVAALHRYAGARDRLCPRPSCPAFFISRNGTRLIYQVVQRVFARLISTIGLQPRSSGCRPRLHDLRHSFAVNTLLEWHATNGDVQARLPLLATHLGHVEVANTYYYLTATPELLAIAARRLEPPTTGLA